MTTLAALSPWALVAVAGSMMLFTLGLVALVLAKRTPGDEVIVRLLPPKIEIRNVARVAELPDPQGDGTQVEPHSALVADVPASNSNTNDAKSKNGA